MLATAIHKTADPLHRFPFGFGACCAGALGFKVPEFKGFIGLQHWLVGLTFLHVPFRTSVAECRAEALFLRHQERLLVLEGSTSLVKFVGYPKP